MTREQWDELFAKIDDMPVEELEKIIVDSARKAGVLQTNADRIRAMSDEELAFYIVNHPMWSDESACIAWLKESISGVKNENLN